MPHFNQTHAPILSKFRSDDAINSNMNKYNGHSNQYTTPYTQQSEDNKRSITSYPQSSVTTTTTAQTTSQPPEISQDLCNAIPQQQNDAKRVLQNVNTGWQSLTADYLSHLPASTLPLSLHHFLKYSAESIKKEAQNPLTTIDMSHAQNTSQSLNLNSLSAGLISNSNISNANILNQPQPPQNQHQQSQHQQQQHQQQQQSQQQQQQQQQSHQQQQSQSNGISNSANPTAITKKKKKKKPPKEKKPRPKPGEIRLTTALDGSTLFCCPECQMAYPERGLLEQYLVGHNLERRFICDICNAALKRKDHLTRKQSHNPERPFVCTICLKAFKRKEQLTLHFVIHSGEKRHVCNECGKGFYRKDHLRKHTRSHIARRVKAELSQQNQTPTVVQNVPQQPSQTQVQNQVHQQQQIQHNQLQQIQHHNISQLNQHQSPPQHQSMMA